MFLLEDSALARFLLIFSFAPVLQSFMDFLLPGVPILLLFSSLDGLDASDIATGGQRSLYCLHGVVGDCLVRLVYRHGKSGWFSSPGISGGCLPTAWGGSWSGAPRLLVIETSDPCYPAM